MQRDNLLASIRKYERVAEEEHGKAKEFMLVGNKRKALYCLKREKIQQNQIQSVTNILDNVENLINTVEFQEIEVEVVNAMRDGKSELEKLNKMLDIDDIEKLMDETAESIDEARRIDAVLSQPIAGITDDDELLAELKGQMEEVTEEKEKVDLNDVNVPMHNIPTKKKEKTPQKEEEEESPVRVTA
ncbi:charged multivesicular body protein 6 [Strigomonas culicis]|nr:charged multivesicular body protein 6 [Strigomonas culicis]|eukprot:EPY28503.1 charged multivesicular body protein 6 [Strigomonas culicis]